MSYSIWIDLMFNLTLIASLELSEAITLTCGKVLTLYLLSVGLAEPTVFTDFSFALLFLLWYHLIWSNTIPELKSMFLNWRFMSLLIFLYQQRIYSVAESKLLRLLLPRWVLAILQTHVFSITFLCLCDNSIIRADFSMSWFGAYVRNRLE